MLNIILGILVGLPVLVGLYTMYCAFRFVYKNGKGIVDQSAGALSFLFVMWTCASQTEIVAKTMPFVTKDLTEWLNIRKDDGHT